jgi:enterochelin esterase-like enzyme
MITKKMYLGWNEIEMTVIEDRLTINSALLKREVICDVLMPEDVEASQPLNLLLLNDGQEIESLKIKQTLQSLYDNNSISPLVIVAIYAGEERLQEYGVANRPDFKNRGAKADTYTQFITTELLPAINDLLPEQEFKTTAFAGFSLGGLSALDIAWNNAQLFDKVGVFSGSLWWRSKEIGKGYTDADRIAHAMIRETDAKPELKFWLQTGTNDETDDRNRNGIIDSIDDTIDLIKELEAKGYNRPADITYVEVVGGSHDAPTWAKAMPKFLCWAFGE